MDGNVPRQESIPEDDEDVTPPRARHATVEEVPDEGDEDERIFTQFFPDGHLAGAAYEDLSSTVFHNIRDSQIEQKLDVLGPFKDDEEWELGQWLLKNVGHNQTEEFLKLKFVKKANLSFKSKDKLYELIDALPKGPQWLCREITQTGDLLDADGKLLTESMELWYRDPVECIRELIGNPIFANCLAYAPVRAFRDRSRKKRHINEMWTANWWWKAQARLPVGKTIVPVILSSDKTKLSQFRGDKSAWPIYLTIGNLSKETRRSPSKHGTILLGYLPIPKFECFSDKKRSLAKYQAFHDCVRIILDSLTKVPDTGIPMTCADRRVRDTVPIVAAYAADYPEQCLVSVCMENRCPSGDIPPDKRGAHEHTCVARDKVEILRLLGSHRRGTLTPEESQRFKDLGLRAVYEPFWQDLPHNDIFQCFTPDLLHQLHKGVFKDHLVKWCTMIMGEDELDARFAAVPPLTGLRHFKNGISSVSQWTGHEHKEMEKVFLGLVVGGVDDEVVKAVRALIDFIYLASLHSHTTTTLAALRCALDNFHASKQAFIDFGARECGHFNIPKYHMLEHYVSLITELGSADGFNTEWSERLHIDYAKDAYRASNKKDFIPQMTTWLSRQEAVYRFATYVDWCRRGAFNPTAGSEPAPVVPDPASILQETTSIHPSSSALGRVIRQSYKIASTHPPELRNIRAATISDDHGAIQFLPALRKFLTIHGSPIKAFHFDTFDLYKQLVLELPSIPEVSDTKLKNVVRASPPVPSSGRRAPQPAHLDFAFVRTGDKNAFTDGTTIEGLRVARVRAMLSGFRT